jgi:hypothetical protein
MVPVKEAFASAVDFATHILEPNRTADIRLEEIETGKSHGREVWFVTLSMAGSDPIPNLLKGHQREYKIFTVDKQSGEVLAMKIRERAAA